MLAQKTAQALMQATVFRKMLEDERLLITDEIMPVLGSQIGPDIELDLEEFKRVTSAFLQCITNLDKLFEGINDIEVKTLSFQAELKATSPTGVAPLPVTHPIHQLPDIIKQGPAAAMQVVLETIDSLIDQIDGLISSIRIKSESEDKVRQASAMRPGPG